MASFSIHLAVGKRYLEKSQNITNENEFYQGIIAPDLASDKSLSHYTSSKDKTNLLNYLAHKVSLFEFLKHESVASDYQKGIFIHLITDYLFFNNFFALDYLENITYSKFCQDLYYSYEFTNEYIEHKYKIDYYNFSDQIKANITRNRKEKNTSPEVGTNILPAIKIDQFIEYVSDINLEDYHDKILKAQKNVFP